MPPRQNLTAQTCRKYTVIHFLKKYQLKNAENICLYIFWRHSRKAHFEKSLADIPTALVYNLIVKIIYMFEVSFGLFSEFDPLKLYYLAYNSDRQKK